MLFPCFSVGTSTKINRRPKRLKEYDQHNLLLAVELVKSGNMSLRKAARLYGVPPTTVYDRLKMNKLNSLK